jgi:hypothetical protein
MHAWIAAGVLATVTRSVVGEPLEIAGILIGAVVVARLARRLVKLAARWLGRRRAQRGPGVVRRHTPRSLLDTGELLSARTEQRIEALAPTLAGAATFAVWVVAAILLLRLLDVRLAAPSTASCALSIARAGAPAFSTVATTATMG